MSSEAEAMPERELERIEEWLQSCEEMMTDIDEARRKPAGLTEEATLYQGQQLHKYLRACTSKRMPALIDEVRRSHTEAAQLRERVEELEGALWEVWENAQPHGGSSPGEAGLQETMYEIADAALRPQANVQAKQKNQEEK